MNENNHKQSPPLRTASTKAKDIYNAYFGKPMTTEHEMHHPNAEQPELTSSVEGHSSTSDNSDNSSELSELKELNAKLQTERDDYRERSLRAIAELENFRRRTDLEKKDIIAHANHRLLQLLLPTLDDLHQAVELGKQSDNYKALMEGIELVFNKATKAFEEAGVQPINPIGEKFDVNFHEALMHIPSEAPEGNIIQVVQKGYKHREKVVRHAKVITSAGQIN